MIKITLAASILAIVALLFNWTKKQKYFSNKKIFILFIWGGILAMPFIIIENYQLSLKHFLALSLLLGIELLLMQLEHSSRYFYKLLHGNQKEYQLTSSMIVLAGFITFEILFSIFISTASSPELIRMIPIKGVFAAFSHISLASIGIHLAATESIIEYLFRFVVRYIKIIFMSISHVFYEFFIEGQLILIILPIFLYNAWIFFQFHYYLKKTSVKEGYGS